MCCQYATKALLSPREGRGDMAFSGTDAPPMTTTLGTASSRRIRSSRLFCLGASLMTLVGCKGPRVGPALDGGPDAASVMAGTDEGGASSVRADTNPMVTSDARIDDPTRSEPGSETRPLDSTAPGERSSVSSQPTAQSSTFAPASDTQSDTLPSDVGSSSRAMGDPSTSSDHPTATSLGTSSPQSSTDNSASTSEQSSSDPSPVIVVEGDLQTAVDEAPDGAILELPAGEVAANVLVGSQRVTFRCSTRGTTYWRSQLITQPALIASFESEIVIERCVFQSCDGGVSASDHSGAILIEGPKRLEVYDSVFRYNTAHRGPVAGNYQSEVGEFVDPDGLIRFQNNVMIANLADDAGAIYISGSTHIELINNLIYGNAAYDYGAAVWLRNQDRENLVFQRNTVVGNSGTRGAGLVTLSGAGATINSSLIGENTPFDIGNSWPLEYSMVTDEAPLTDPEAGDFRLVAGSSAIDSGDPSLFDNDGSRADQGVDLALLPMDLLE